MEKLFRFLSKYLPPRFLLYLMTGMMGTGINMLFFMTMVHLTEISPVILSPMAVEIALIASFFMHNRWTFHLETGNHKFGFWHRFLIFHLASGISSLINFCVFLLLYKLTKTPLGLCQISGITIGGICNYFLNSRITWKNRPPGP